MNFFKISSLSFLVLFSLILGSVAFAETPAPKPQVSAATVLATVNIQGAKIVSQNNNTVNLSFSLTNREGVQTGVKYGVKLIKVLKDNNKQVIDEKIYDESLTLNPNSAVKKEITYVAPSTLSGEYTIVIISSNSNGFMFGLSTAGKINLTGVSKGLQILSESCFLQVPGDKKDTKYALNQGVDILMKENLKLTCSVENSSTVEVSGIPTYETRYRSSYGDVVSQNGGSKEPIVFKAKEKKMVSVILPKASSPQAYNVIFSLSTKDGETNSVNVHYVIHGISGTIQNLSLDKDFYKKGEQAKISFVYTQSADAFPGSRLGASDTSHLSYTVKMTNGEGEPCFEPLTQAVNQKSSRTDVAVKVNSKCLNPKVALSVSDEDGTIIDQKEFSVPTTSLSSKSSIIIYAIIIIFVLALIPLIYKKYKNRNIDGSANTGIPVSIILPFLLVMAVSFVPASKAHADSFEVYDYYAPDMTSVVFTVNIDKSEYNLGESMNIDSYMTYGGCGNDTRSSSLMAENASGLVSLFSESSWNKDTFYGGDPFFNNNTTISNPPTPGAYSITFTGIVNANSSQSISIPFSVLDPNPTCSNGANNYPTCTKSCPDGSTTVTNGECPVVNTTPPPPAPTPLSVTVYANGNPSDITIPYNGSADISWTSVGATSCTCSYEGGDCTPSGATAGSDISAANNPYTLTQTKTFNVTCTDGTNTTSGGGTDPTPPSCPFYYPTCFVADTLVTMADGSKKNIQDVKIGDILKGGTTNNKVLGFHQPQLNQKKLYSFNGGRYFVTAEHPFKTTKGWKSINPALTASENIGIEVTELKVGDTLVTDNGNVLLKTIDSKNDKADTQLYNFILDGDHTYYADGYLVHNKLACVDGQVPNPITGGCEPDCYFNCPSGYTKSCEMGATKCTQTTCTLN